VSTSPSSPRSARPSWPSSTQAVSWVSKVGIGAGGGGVVLAAGAHVGGGPRGPAVGGRDDLDVAAGVAVLARPPQIHPPGRAGSGGAAGVDQRAVQQHMGVDGGLGGQQRPVQGRVSARPAPRLSRRGSRRRSTGRCRSPGPAGPCGCHRTTSAVPTRPAGQCSTTGCPCGCRGGPAPARAGRTGTERCPRTH
jgi:hypothetical protein